jgi:hypothetical protein
MDFPTSTYLIMTCHKKVLILLGLFMWYQGGENSMMGDQPKLQVLLQPYEVEIFKKITDVHGSPNAITM